jgi:hypothetical protein
MPYNIELMSIGDDIYLLLERAAAALNGIQREFKFNTTSPAQRPAGIAFRRSNYLTTDIWTFLKDHKETFGGNRPYIIDFEVTILCLRYLDMLSLALSPRRSFVG